MTPATPSEFRATDPPWSASRATPTAGGRPVDPLLVSVLVDCTAGDCQALSVTVESVLSQGHRNVEITLCGHPADCRPGELAECLHPWRNRAWHGRGLAWEPGCSAAGLFAAYASAAADASIDSGPGPLMVRGDVVLLLPAGTALDPDACAATCREHSAGEARGGSVAPSAPPGRGPAREAPPQADPSARLSIRALARRARLAMADAAGGVLRAACRPGDRRVADELGIFDRRWYLEAYPDVADSGTDPFRHYMRHGWREGRLPYAAFDEPRYGRLVPGYRPGHGSPVSDMLERFRRGALAAPEIDRIRRSAIRLREGVTLSGYLCSEIGLGQAARMLAHAMDSARVPMGLRDLPLPGRANEHGFLPFLSREADRRVSLLVAGMEDAGRRSWPHPSGARRLLYPFWELSCIPDAWRAGVREHDAVWAPSGFVAAALRRIGIEAPVIRQPVVVPPSRDLVPIRTAGSPLSVLTYLDFDSFPARKNVRASVAAFLQAFPAGRGASLTVKVRGAGGQGERAWLEAESARDPRIRVIDATISWSEVNALVRDCDVFLSMHRSEGFGFGAAEALAHAKAVVATDYGGTSDFVRPDTGYPVRHSMVDVGPGDYPGGEGQQWADPDIDAAARALRSIDADRAGAAALGQAGHRRMRTRHSPESTGRVMREWLEDRGWIGRHP